MNKENYNPENLRKIGNQLILVKQIIQLQTDLINRIPGPERLSKQEVIVQFMTIYSETNNIFDLNQDLTKILEEAGSGLYSIAEELEESANENI